MQERTNRVYSISEYNLAPLMFPIVTVYENPKDYPNKYVARVFETIPEPTPTDAVVIYDTKEELDKDLWESGYRTFFPRQKFDDKAIIGSYLK